MRPIILFATVLCMGLGAALGMTAVFIEGYWSEPDERLLLTVLREVREQYVEEVPRTQLVDNAIRGILAGLDDHSAFLDKQALTLMQEDTTGKFGGIGVHLGLVDGFVTVVTLLHENTPAARAGIVAGDRVVEVDRQSLKGRTLGEAVNRLRGEPGTDLHVRIHRGTAPDLLDFDLTRDTIAVASVRGRTLAPGYGYVKVERFNETTIEDLYRAVDELGEHGALRGLVVDLRDNPGGLLEMAVELADAFLAEGLIVSIKGRAEDIDRRYEATPEELLAGVPLAVLLNRGAASASEVVAGALQDHGRATVIGTRSYGKGSVQSVVYFQNRRAIKLTTAHYYTPNGPLHPSGRRCAGCRHPQQRTGKPLRVQRTAAAGSGSSLGGGGSHARRGGVVAAVGLEPTTPAL